MNFKFKRDNQIIEEMMKELGNIDMGNVTGDWQEASMDREMKQKDMSPEERQVEIMNAYSIGPFFELTPQFFPPVNGLRDDTAGTKSSSNPFKEGLKVTANPSKKGLDMNPKGMNPRDERGAESDGRSLGEE